MSFAFGGDPRSAIREGMRLLSSADPNEVIYGLTSIGRTCADNQELLDECRRVGVIEKLAKLARSPHSTVKLVATEKLATMAYSNRENQMLIMRLGLMPDWVRMISSGDELAIQVAALCVINMTTQNHAVKEAFRGSGVIEPLIRSTQNVRVKEEVRAIAARALNNLAFENEGNKVAIREAGGLEALCAMLRVRGSDEPKVRALDAMCSVVGKSNREMQIALVEAGAVELLLDLLERGSNALQDRAGQVLGLLSRPKECLPVFRANSATRTLCKQIEKPLRSHFTFQVTIALANLTRDSPPDLQIVKEERFPERLVRLIPKMGMTAVRAIGRFLLENSEEAKNLFAEAGAVAAFIQIIRRGSNDDKAVAAECLHVLLEPRNDLVKTLVCREGGVSLLLSLLGSGTMQGKVNAMLCLSKLFANNPAAVQEAKSRGMMSTLARFVGSREEELGINAMYCLEALGPMCSKEIAETGTIIPRLTELATNDDKDHNGESDLRNAAILAITNLQLNVPEVWRALDEAETLPKIVRYLNTSSSDNGTRLVACLFIGWMATDGPEIFQRLVDAGVVEALLHHVMIPHRNKSPFLEVLSHLCRIPEAKVTIGESGVFPEAVRLVAEGVEMEKQFSLLLLLNSCSEKICREKMIDAGVIRSLTQVFESGKFHDLVINCLGNLSGNFSGGELPEIMMDPRLLGEVVTMIRQDDDDKVRSSGLRVLTNFVGQNKRNREQVLALGVAKDLIKFLERGSESLQTSVAMALYNFFSHHDVDSMRAFMGADVIPPLCRILKSTNNPTLKELAAHNLGLLCQDFASAEELVVREGSMDELMAYLKANANSRMEVFPKSTHHVHKIIDGEMSSAFKIESLLEGPQIERIRSFEALIGTITGTEDDPRVVDPIARALGDILDTCEDDIVVGLALVAISIFARAPSPKWQSALREVHILDPLYALCASENDRKRQLACEAYALLF